MKLYARSWHDNWLLGLGFDSTDSHVGVYRLEMYLGPWILGLEVRLPRRKGER